MLQNAGLHDGKFYFEGRDLNLVCIVARVMISPKDSEVFFDDGSGIIPLSYVGGMGPVSYTGGGGEALKHLSWVWALGTLEYVESVRRFSVFKTVPGTDQIVYHRLLVMRTFMKTKKNTNDSSPGGHKDHSASQTGPAEDHV